jgi:glyoxylase-like metal-dependent hydrolase (beta-lactamase superfamily II)
MANLIYLIGDVSTRECYVVDPCWDVGGIVDFARKHRMKIVGAIASHYHFDHVGGFIFEPMMAMVYGPFAKEMMAKGASQRLCGLAEMGWEHGCKLYVHQSELGPVQHNCKLTREELTPIRQGSRLPLGEAGELEVLHTPGHSPGSVCLCVRSAQRHGEVIAVISGDTLFPGSCGRLDSDDSSVTAMFDSLAKLRTLDSRTPVYPGHAYGGKVTTIGKEKVEGMLRPFTREMFAKLFA